MERRVSEQEKQATSWWKTQIFSVAFIFSVMIILLLLLKPWEEAWPFVAGALLVGILLILLGRWQLRRLPHEYRFEDDDPAAR